MSPPPNVKIEQQSAKALAQGYSATWRMVEVLSIITFWGINLVIAIRAWPFMGVRPWVTATALAAGYVMADFTSGFVHWLFDTWGDTSTAVVGQTVIRPFREHHVDQKAMTRHDYIETNGANCLVAVPFALGAAVIPLAIPGWEAIGLFVQLSITSMNLWVMMTNQFHKWAHQEPGELGPLLVFLQRKRIILDPQHHQRHHTAPFTTYYCITHGWLNWGMHQIQFFRHLERLVTAITGAIPRRDDIGLEAALAVAPLKPLEPSADPEIDLPPT
jgi:ubiquitin-conjugating enzyme E2 variant